ncbi:MAG: hypothetical protein AAGB51_02640 [Planctomycetota bacterium]
MPNRTRNPIAGSPAASLAAAALLGGVIAGGLSGCQSSDDRYRFQSSPHVPKSVTVVDTSTEEVVWAYDIPVGSELRVNFGEDKYEYGALTPNAKMRYVLYPSGERGEIAVPPRGSRRLDMTVRPGPEEFPAPEIDPVVPPAPGGG